jgi:hypothetical protein
VPHLSRTLRKVGFHELVRLGILVAPRPGKGATSVVPHWRTHNRGREALQRRVKHPQSNRASAPVDVFAATAVSRRKKPKTLVIPNRAESPVRVCPERSRREPAIRRRHHEARVPILRALCEGACPEQSRRVGFHGSRVLDFCAAQRSQRRDQMPTQPRIRTRLQSRRNLPHAPPWKSGASAPRQSSKKITGLQPQWKFAPTQPRRKPKNSCHSESG